MNQVLQKKLEKRNPFKASDGTIRLAFCGKMKSGKDTAAGYLRDRHGGTVMHVFAAGYRFVELILLYWLFGAKIDPDNKTKFERLMLQWVGHWGRVLFGKDVWLRKTMKIIAKTPGNVFITGVRYPNEIRRLREIEVQSVWIDRPEADRIAAGAFNLDHETETALDGFTEFDYKIPNDKDKTTFLRRVECYSHIDKILGDSYFAKEIRQDRVAAGRGAASDATNFSNVASEDGRIGWQPGEVARSEGPTETGDHDADNEVFSDRKKFLDSQVIANEIRRFADIVQNELYVTDADVAVESVRATLHKIIDNRPINGTEVEESKPIEPRTREQILEEFKNLALEAGGEGILLTNATAEEVENALAYYRKRPTLEEEMVTNEALKLLTKERARRDAWNQERRDRRAEARLDKVLKASRKRGSKLKADTLKAAAKKSRR